MSRKEARRPGLVQVGGGREDHHRGRGPRPGDQPRGSSAASRPGIGPRGCGAWCIATGAGRRHGRLDVEIRDRVAELVQTTYRDFNDCHCHRDAPRARGPGRQPQHRPPASPGAGPAAQAPAPAAAAPRPPPAPCPAMGALVLVDGSEFDWLGTGHPRLPPRRHRRRDEHRRGPPLPPRRRPARLSHPAGPPRRTGRAARDPLRRSPRRLRAQRRALDARGGTAGRAASDPLRPGPPGPRRSATSPPTRPRPRAASNACGPPCRIASSPNSASARSTPSRRPRPSCPPTSAAHNRRFAQPPAETTAGLAVDRPATSPIA